MTTPSLFAQYIYERSNKAIIEDENGFASYYYIGDTCYIEDLYVKKGMRNKHIASQYANKIAEEAKSKKATQLMGSVNLNTMGATDSMKILLAYGFQLQSAGNNIIYLVKALRETT